MINVIAGNDFRLIVTAKKSVGVSVGVLDLTEVDDLRIYLTRAGRSKMSQSYALDDYGRAIVYVNARDVAVGVYGIELMGVMSGSNLRAHKTNVLTVSGHGHGNEGVLLDYEVDIVLSVNVPTTDAYVQAAIEAHNEDENAHPELQTEIADKVDDVLVDGESVVETDPITGKRTVGFRKDQFGKVDDVLVNGRSVVGEGGVARIDSQDFKGERGNGITSIEVEESQEDGGDNIVHIHCTDDEEEGGTQFRVMNGRRGNGIASVTEQTSSEDGGINTHTFTDTDGHTHVIHTRNGRAGTDFQPIEDVSGLQIAHSLGDSETKVMSQKGVNEAINEHTYVGDEDLELELDTYQESDGWIGTDNKWSSSSYKCRFIPVTAGKTYRIKRNASANSTYAFVVSDDVGDAGDLVSTFAIGVTGVTNLNQMLAEIVAPADARYLYVGSTVNTTNDRLPQSLIELNRTSISSSIAEICNDLNSYGLPKIIDLTSITEEHIGASGSGKWLSYVWYGKFLYVDGIKKILLKGGTNFTYYLLLKSGSHVLNADVDYATGYSANGNTLEANKTVIVDVPADAKYMFFLTKRGTGSTIACEPAQVTFLGEVVTQNELNKNNFPSFLTIDSEDSGVLYTIDNFIMKHSFEDNVEYLSFSTDLGKSWTTVENTFDEKITHVHYFADGTFMLCTPDKCYWTKDFETFTESTIYDYDGSIYQPVEGETRFYATKDYERTFINGKEWHFFGDYVQTTPNPRLWCTTDYGRTLRCVYAFGLSSINETVYGARHIHAFEYNPFDKKFYVLTGDNANECHVIKGTCAEGVWAWEHVATGDEWKLTQPKFFEGYMVAVTDYTTQALANKKGIIRCPTEDMLADNFTYWFKASSEIMGNAAITKYFRDKNGWRIILPDYAGGAKVLMAKNDLDFVWVNNTDGLRICGFTACNHKGDVYAFYRNVGTSVVGEDWLKIQIPSFNLTKAMRKAGASDFLDYLTTEF